MWKRLNESSNYYNIWKFSENSLEKTFDGDLFWWSCSLRKTSVMKTPFIKVTGPWNITKHGLQWRCLPVNFAKYWREAILLVTRCFWIFDQPPCTQNVNWTYIKPSDNIHHGFWTSYVRLIYVLCPDGSLF